MYSSLNIRVIACLYRCVVTTFGKTSKNRMKLAHKAIDRAGFNSTSIAHEGVQNFHPKFMSNSCLKSYQMISKSYFSDIFPSVCCNDLAMAGQVLALLGDNADIRAAIRARKDDCVAAQPVRAAAAFVLDERWVDGVCFQVVFWVDEIQTIRCYQIKDLQFSCWVWNDFPRLQLCSEGQQAHLAKRCVLGWVTVAWQLDWGLNFG